MSAQWPNIAFIGKAGSGKSTLSEHLIKSYSYRRLSFAQPLKDAAALIWGDTARTDREKLQRLGVAVREIEEDAWVNALVRKVEAGWAELPAEFGNEPRWVVDDLRFPNEWWALRALGFKIIRVQVPLTQRRERLKRNGKSTSPEQEQHISETVLDEFAADTEIENWDGEIEKSTGELNRNVERWLR